MFRKFRNFFHIAIFNLKWLSFFIFISLHGVLKEGHTCPMKRSSCYGSCSVMVNVVQSCCCENSFSQNAGQTTPSSLYFPTAASPN